MGPDQRAGEPVMMISSSVREQRSTSDVDSMLDRNVVGDATEKARGDLKRVLGAGYILVMALCGMVAVALGSTLEDLAANCNRESTEVGLVFIARGVGATLGGLISSKIYLLMRGNTVVVGTLLLFAAVLMCMPFITSVYALYLAYFLIGVCVGVINTGCQIMTQKIFGAKAGKWLGYNNASMGISGVIIPLIAYTDDSLVVQYAVLCGTSFVAAVYLAVLPAPEAFQGLMEETSEQHTVAARERPKSANTHSWRVILEKYHVELSICVMVFCVVGAKATATAYLESYIDDTGVIESSQEGLLLVDLWIGIAFGLVIGLLDLRTASLPRLYRHASIAFVCGGVAASTILIFQTSPVALWMGVAGFGLFNGPTVVYCYDLQRRITNPSEAGISLVMFGVNFGPCVVPYVFSLVDDATEWPESLIVVLILTSVISFLVILNTSRITLGKRKKRDDDLSAGYHGSSTSLLSPPQEREEEIPLLYQANGDA